jgi:predicted  nucleic acid-binding Zn-ribbon protein
MDQKEQDRLEKEMKSIYHSMQKVEEQLDHHKKDLKFLEEDRNDLQNIHQKQQETFLDFSEY